MSPSSICAGLVRAQPPVGDLAAALNRYRETFHTVTFDSSGNPIYSFDEIVIPYLPYFANCEGYDSYIPIFALFEDNACAVPPIGTGVTPERVGFPPFPSQDDIRVVSPLSLMAAPIADVCARTLECRYEEDLSQEEINPRWFESSTGTQLFSLIRTPLTLEDYLSDSGTIYRNMVAAQTTDVFIAAYTDTVCGGQQRLPSAVPVLVHVNVCAGGVVGACWHVCQRRLLST
jgi:hypothetical protein